MKKLYNYITSIIFLLTFLAPQFSSAQLVAIIGYNGTSPDGISFVALQAIPASTVIYFTENEHLGGGSFNTGEGVWDWVAPAGGILKGVVIVMTETSTNVMTTTCATPPCESSTPTTYQIPISLASTAESVYAYSDSDTDPSNGTTEIYSVFRSDGALPGGEDPSVFSPNAVIVDGLTGDTHAQFTVALRSAAVTIMDIEDPTKYTQISGNSPLSTAPFTTILPVELIDFNAKKRDQNISLKWKTASEINNDYFDVERSKDGVEFELIGMVKGEGTTELISEYSYLDRDPLEGYNYYRLKQVDFNDKFEYSPIIVVDFRGIKHTDLQLAPNPFNDQLNIILSEPVTKNTQFTIHDMMGRIVFTGILEEDQLSKNIHLSNLQSGVFILQIGEGENAISQRIVKL